MSRRVPVLTAELLARIDEFVTVTKEFEVNRRLAAQHCASIRALNPNTMLSTPIALMGGIDELAELHGAPKRNHHQIQQLVRKVEALNRDRLSLKRSVLDLAKLIAKSMEADNRSPKAVRTFGKLRVSIRNPKSAEDIFDRCENARRHAISYRAFLTKRSSETPLRPSNPADAQSRARVASRKRGRKRKFDRDNDNKLYADFQVSGLRVKEFARERNLPFQEVDAALKRARANRSRDKHNAVKPN